MRVPSLAATLRLLPVALFAMGTMLAIYFADVGWHAGEPLNAAAALLHRGIIGDPYLLPTGPSAHVSPILTVFMAGVYAVFGVDSWGSNVALGVVTAAIHAMGVAIAFRAMAAARVSALGQWIAIAVVLATSLLLYYAVTYGRVWEQPISALVLVTGWLTYIRFGASARPDRLLAAMAALTGVSFLLTASIMPSLAVALLLMLWRDRRRAGLPRRAALCALIICAFAVPWGARNEIELGKFIVTRSNFGLELAVGNQPGANGPSSSGWTAPIHPSVSPEAARAVQTMGEVAYMAKMTEQARDWIRADPARFIRLTAVRAWLSVFPDQEMVPWFPAIGAKGALLILLAFGAAKAIALLTSLLSRIRPVEMLLFCVLPVAPYIVTHVNPRYVILNYFTTIVMIALVGSRATPFSRSPSPE